MFPQEIAFLIEALGDESEWRLVVAQHGQECVT